MCLVKSSKQTLLPALSACWPGVPFIVLLADTTSKKTKESRYNFFLLESARCVAARKLMALCLFARNNVKIFIKAATVIYVQNKQKAHFYFERFSKWKLFARWTFLLCKVRNKFFSQIFLKFGPLNVQRLKSPCNCSRQLLMLSIEFKPITLHLRYRETFKVISVFD